MTSKAIPSLAFFVLSLSASAQIVAINGIDRDGYGGTYEISGSNYDGGTYWWMCAEPIPGTIGAGNGQGMIADSLSLAGGWDRQNTERLFDYSANPGFYTTAYPRQIGILSYVLDTYLRWDLAGSSGRFTEQSSTSANFGNDDTFYNSFFTVQNVLNNVYGAPGKTDYTDISSGEANPFTFYEGNATGNSPAIAARQDLFLSIVNDVDAKADSSFFDTYVAQGTYMIASSTFSTANNSLGSEDANKNWQDALIIVAPVPEPSGALLIACSGLAFMFRRFRRVTIRPNYL